MNALECLRRQRANVMAMAALWVAAYHGCITLHVPFLDAILKKGDQAVDLFVFLAGFGLAFALEKRPSCRSYWTRRMKRLLPSYYVTLILGLILTSFRPSLTELCSRFLLTGVWLGNWAYWYICASLLYYLLAPPIWYALRYSRFPRTMLALLMAVFCLAFPCATRGWGEIALMRIPALVLGLMCGVEYFRGKDRRSNAVVLAVLLACGVCGVFLYKHNGTLNHPLQIVSDFQGYWLAFDLIGPMLAVILAIFFELLERTPLRFLNRIMAHLGKYTLEIYLSHKIVFRILEHFIHTNNRVFAASLVIGYPMIRLIAWLGEQLLKLWTRLMRVCFPAEAD